MKKRLLRSLQPLATRLPLQWLVNATGQRLFLPFYHSVQKDRPLPHIQHLYTLRTIDEFEKDLDFLLKHYQPIDLSGLVRQVKSGQPFEANTFFLSFDDGLREIADWIAPLLLKKGVPATYFLNSQFVDNKDLFFRYKASLLIDHLKKKEISQSNKNIIQSILGTQDILPAILNINYQSQDILDRIAEHLEVNFKAFLNQQKPYLDKAQIKDLIQKGFTFGSHSIDHPLYHDLDLDEQIRQTKESQAFINEHFAPSIKAFAFPFSDYGVSASFFQNIQRENILDISFGTAGLKQDSTPFHLQRFPVEAFPFQMHELVSSEYFYYFGKSFLGKNRINRK